MNFAYLPLLIALVIATPTISQQVFCGSDAGQPFDGVPASSEYKGESCYPNTGTPAEIDTLAAAAYTAASASAWSKYFDAQAQAADDAGLDCLGLLCPHGGPTDCNDLLDNDRFEDAVNESSSLDFPGGEVCITVTLTVLPNASQQIKSCGECGSQPGCVEPVPVDDPDEDEDETPLIATSLVVEEAVVFQQDEIVVEE